MSALVAGLTPTDRTGRGPDATSVLIVFITVRLVLPSQFVVAVLRGAGSPALLLALCCLVWWSLARIQRTHAQQSSPVIGALVIFTAMILASFYVGMARPISGEEVSVSTLTLISIAGWFGAMLLAHDGIPNAERLLDLLHYLATLGGLLALFGLFQFVTGQYWVDQISIPGLEAHQAVFSATLREGFTRPAGTSVHPIEFGAVMTMLLPLALARGVGQLPIAGAGRLSLLARWWPALAMGLAIVLSLSRSAVIGLAVGAIALALTWTPRQRIAAIGGLTGLLAVVFLAVPGVAGSILGLFSAIGQGDSSVTSRVESYAIADAYISQAPLFGRGIGTFLPRYRIFDNEYLLLLVEIGFLGVIALLILIATSLWSAARVYLRSNDARLRGAAAAVAASTGSGAVSLALFDGFSFPMVPGLWFLMMGLCGATYRLWQVAEHRYVDRTDA
ncbi:O-antigen ligase family protein [Microbacterium sp. Leaf288]|uniref:O-antigen ligase family protein n=1 Tax=Microbacterium sp. Leaf288 TaxID=1736323 RepID=UPI000A9AD88A|nr:O-antigen ligase family protein [Microbacterium sp. Leaf288]